MRQTTIVVALTLAVVAPCLIPVLVWSLGRFRGRDGSRRLRTINSALQAEIQKGPGRNIRGPRFHMKA